MSADPAETDRLVGAIVLLVEDDPPSAKLAARILGAAGCLVSAAASVKEATAMLFAGLVPALVVLDLDLPDLSGMDFARVLRSLDATRLVPIIAVSASGIAFGETAARDAGCDGFVRKPIDVTTFAGTIAGFLGSAHSSTRR